MWLTTSSNFDWPRGLSSLTVANFRSATAIACRSNTKGTSLARMDIILPAPDHPSAFSRGVCIRVESRMKRSPLSSFVRALPPPSGNKPPKEFRKLDRVYTVERLHAKIEGNGRRFHEYIYIYMFLLSFFHSNFYFREEKSWNVLLYAICTIQKNRIIFERWLIFTGFSRC